MNLDQNQGTRIWDRNAEEWHRSYGERDPNRGDLLDPLILDLLGEVKGKRILDAGCGDGYLSRKLARLGAKVTGVEISIPSVGEFLAESVIMTWVIPTL